MTGWGRRLHLESRELDHGSAVCIVDERLEGLGVEDAVGLEKLDDLWVLAHHCHIVSRQAIDVFRL